MQASPRRGRLVAALILLGAVGLTTSSHALSITLTPSADASLIEVSPDNSIGAQAFVLSGRTQNGPHVRALYRFDLSALPTNAIVLSAVLQLECTRQSGEPACVTPVAFGLHRMLRPWGEGTNVAVQGPGQGIPAQPGDATWHHAFHPTNAWSAPGGLVGTDFSSVESSFQYVTTPDASPYLFESTPELVDDVQTWVRDPQANHGWMMIANPEEVLCTARRFNARESEGGPPLLMIEYSLPPAITVLSLQLNLATGLYEQRVRVGNPAGSGLDALRLWIRNLPATVQVANASGVSNGVPFVQSSGTVPTGSSVEFTIEYHTSGGAIPNPTLEVESVPVAPEPSPTTSAGQRINRALRRSDGTLLLEFATESNRLYHVQYSTDLTWWKTAPPAITGNGTWHVWIDHGQPKTDSAPTAATRRFYRVLRE